MIDVHRTDPEEFLAPGLATACDHWLKKDFGALIDAESSGTRAVWATVSPPHHRADAVCAEVRVLFQIPTEHLLSLRAFRDTFEGSFETPDGQVLWCAHEVQKGIRLALRQSHMMLEMLGGHPLLNDAGQLVELLRGGVTAQSVSTYREMSRGLFRRAIEGDEQSRWPALRHALTGLRLASERHLTLDGVALVDWSRAAHGELPHGFEEQTKALLDAMAEALTKTELPDKPDTYDDLSRWLVEMRLDCPSAQGVNADNFQGDSGQ